MIRIFDWLAEALVTELSQQRHNTGTERQILSAIYAQRRAKDVLIPRELVAQLTREFIIDFPSAQPTPAELTLIKMGVERA